MLTTKEFFSLAKQRLNIVKESQRNAVLAAAQMMGDCMSENGVVQLFGIGSGRAFSMELGYRAGGLMPFHQMNLKDLALRNIVSEERINQEGFEDDLSMVDELLDLYRIEDNDMFILVSESGCEGVLIETALRAKEKGQKVIAVVSMNRLSQTPAHHPSGMKLSDVADLIIDNGADYPDCLLDVDGVHKMNQMASISGNVIAQMMTAETYHYLVEQGKECPILLSANVKGADVHNRALSDKYIGRWNS